jgi:PAS domain-containing protein
MPIPGRSDLARGPGDRVRLRTFPSDDRAFAAFVEDASIASGDVPLSPERLQAAIRERYPAAVVRAQADFARTEPWESVWYAFRFGAIAPAPPDVDVDWTSPDVAWAVVDDDRRFLDLSESLADIMELDAERIIGHAVEEFVNPADPTMVEDLAVLWERFRAAGSAESTIRFNYADGRPRQLAYRISANADGPGLHRLLVRVIATE